MKKTAFILGIALVLLTPLIVYSQAPRQKILIGLIPEMNIFSERERFKLLGEYLSKKTGVAMDFTILSRYGNILERFTAEKMDGAFFGSFTGALAIDKLGVIPLARPVDLDNTSTYRGYIFVRKDGGIRGVKDMKGKKMAFVEKATTAGYIFPLAYLRENGVSDRERFFGESYFMGSHDAAVDAVLDRKADVGAAKDSVYRRMRKENPRIDRELIVLAESPEVPSNGLCVRRGLEEILKQKLKDALLNMDRDPEGKAVLKKFGALRFLETTKEEYRPVAALAEEAGIDIKRDVPK